MPLSLARSSTISDPSPESTKWQIKADRWHDKYVEDNKSITWMYLKQSILSTADTVKKRSAEGAATEESKQARPKLAPSLPAAVALSAVERQEIYDQAFHAALAAFQANDERRGDTRQCFRCGKIGHIERFCRQPAAGAPMQRVSRWDRVGGLQGGGSGFGRGGSMPPGLGNVDSGSYEAGRGTGGVGGDSGTGGGRGMGGGGGFGRGVSADSRFAGRGGTARRGAFGRGVPSRPLSSVVGQQSGMFCAEYPEFPDFEHIDNSAFHAYVPGSEQEDRDAAFREQAFGSGQDFGQASDNTDNIEWQDPVENPEETTIEIDTADPLPANLPPPTRYLHAVASRSLNLFTSLPLALETLFILARRCFPTHLPRTP
mmetsp:Transcript_60527/g.124576  ORF Transcript_60527/g.124576 Transcript_60527/m.124576 type:complete len:372 (+) Transcript_60527:382-1497(+)